MLITQNAYAQEQMRPFVSCLSPIMSSSWAQRPQMERGADVSVELALGWPSLDSAAAVEGILHSAYDIRR